MQCAVVDTITNRVVNIIIADPATDSVDGAILIANPPSYVSIGTEFRDDAFVPPKDGRPDIDGFDTL
jgi:hypothetical protein